MNCAQVEVEGNGTAVPTGLVAIPGAYSPEDPGVWWNVYKNKSTTYVAPGPRPWKCPT